MTNREAFEAKFPIPAGIMWAFNQYQPDTPAGDWEEAAKCNRYYNVWQAATKHQDALIAAAYLDAAKLAEFHRCGEKCVRLLGVRNTDNAKAALRELCLQVAKELVEHNQDWIMTNTVREEMDIVEAIVDKVLAG